MDGDVTHAVDDLFPTKKFPDELKIVGSAPAKDLEFGLAANARWFVAGNFSQF
jgi:hypothetical protein